MRADVSSTAELLSREFENWDYAAARYHSSPFTWINAGPLEGLHGDALPPSYVQTQLTAVRKFGMGGGFGNFHYGGGLKPSWYAPYADAIRSRRQARERRRDRAHAPRRQPLPGRSRERRTTTLRSGSSAGGTTWEEAGVAELDFRITEGDMLYIKDWRMDWRIPRSALTNGASSVRVVAVDIKRQHLGARRGLAGGPRR